MGVERVLLMPDPHRLSERALLGLEARGGPLPDAQLLAMPISGMPEDSQRAAALMREAGAACLVVLGGDGTVRVAARGAGSVPILPISSGTNNVLPTCVEGTIAGLAAAGVALGLVPREEACLQHKRLRLWLDGVETSDALVDVAVLAGHLIGARAVWDVSALRQVLVTRASPATIGISAIAGVVRPVAPEEPLGLALRLDAHSERCVLAPVGPGLMARLHLAELREILPAQRVDVVAERPLVLALDGEREFTLTAGREAWLSLDLGGPWIVDATRAMMALAARGHLSQPEA